MQARLAKVHQSAPDAKVFVRGDRDTVHGNIVQLLDMLRSAGFYKISFEIKSEALKGVPGAREVIIVYGADSKTFALPATATLAVVGGDGWRSGDSPHRGCAGSKTRATAG